ncbi:MAG: hypothetical protein LBM16_00265, partial [Clostridiales bacterium]|nr:hypothetical protein [Clostridiales bacterium]
CQIVKRVAEVALAVKTEFMDKVCSWYSEDVLRDEINKFFAMMKLAELPKDVTDDIILCIISILQCIPVFDRRGNEICRTTFFATAKEISLVVMMKSGEVSDPTITPVVMAKVIKLERESKEFLNGVAEITTRKPYYIVREKGQLGIKKL